MTDKHYIRHETGKWTLSCRAQGEKLLTAVLEYKGEIQQAIASLHRSSDGLSMQHPRLRAEDFAYAIERLSPRHATWATALYSYAIKELTQDKHGMINAAMAAIDVDTPMPRRR